MLRNETEEQKNLQSIKDKLEAHSIRSVIFDLDGTLIETEQYYKEAMIGSAQAYLNARDIEYTETNLQLIYMYGVNMRNQAQRPLLISAYMTGAIEKFLTRKQCSTDGLDEFIKEYLKDFYNGTPELKNGTLEILRILSSLGVPIGIYSHAQYDWTAIKVRRIEEEYLEKTNNKIDISFFTTPIEKKKDEKGWREAANSFGFNLRTSLVVGDSKNSDIIPAMRAGCQNLVYITTSQEARKDLYVSVTPDISQLFDVL